MPEDWNDSVTLKAQQTTQHVKGVILLFREKKKDTTGAHFAAEFHLGACVMRGRYALCIFICDR